MTENKIVRDKMPLVSVVVPIYNVELYLKECVDSILSQTCRKEKCVYLCDYCFLIPHKLIADITDLSSV